MVGILWFFCQWTMCLKKIQFFHARIKMVFLVCFICFQNVCFLLFFCRWEVYELAEVFLLWHEDPCLWKLWQERCWERPMESGGERSRGSVFCRASHCKKDRSGFLESQGQIICQNKLVYGWVSSCPKGKSVQGTQYNSIHSPPLLHYIHSVSFHLAFNCLYFFIRLFIYYFLSLHVVFLTLFNLFTSKWGEHWWALIKVIVFLSRSFHPKMGLLLSKTEHIQMLICNVDDSCGCVPHIREGSCKEGKEGKSVWRGDL